MSLATPCTLCCRELSSSTLQVSKLCVSYLVDLVFKKATRAVHVKDASLVELVPLLMVMDLKA